MTKSHLRPNRPSRNIDEQHDAAINDFAHASPLSSQNKTTKAKVATQPYSFSLTRAENERIERLRTKGSPDVPILNRTEIIRFGLFMLEQQANEEFIELWQNYKAQFK